MYEYTSELSANCDGILFLLVEKRYMSNEDLKCKMGKNFIDFDHAIARLIKDGYIFRNVLSGNMFMYVITDEGEFFWLNGGYLIQSHNEKLETKEKDNEKKRKKRLDNSTINMNIEILKGIEFNKNVAIITLIVAIITLISSCWNSNIKPNDSEAQKQFPPQQQK